MLIHELLPYLPLEPSITAVHCMQQGTDQQLTSIKLKLHGGTIIQLSSWPGSLQAALLSLSWASLSIAGA
jgi:hypothetical protein